MRHVFPISWSNDWCSTYIQDGSLLTKWIISRYIEHLADAFGVWAYEGPGCKNKYPDWLAEPGSTTCKSSVFGRVEGSPNPVKPISDWQRRLARILVWTLLLSGCTLPPPSTLPFFCSSFTESYWEEFSFGVDSPDSVTSTAARLWEIGEERFEVDLTVSGDVWNVRWASIATIGPSGEYLAWFRDDETLVKISAYWGNPRPTLTETIDCLGDPDHYFAFLYPTGEVEYLSLALLYTDKRIIVHHNNPSWSAKASEIHPDMRMDSFIVIAHGSAEQLLTDMYSHGYVVRHRAQSECLLKSWPGSIEAMEAASIEERSRCGVYQ